MSDRQHLFLVYSKPEESLVLNGWTLRVSLFFRKLKLVKLVRLTRSFVGVVAQIYPVPERSEGLGRCKTSRNEKGVRRNPPLMPLKPLKPLMPLNKATKAPDTYSTSKSLKSSVMNTAPDGLKVSVDVHV